MRISMRADYGGRAMTDLAMHYGDGPIAAADVARRMFVPAVYLDQVLSALRQAGLVRSTRGPRGGHELVRAPEKITMADVVVPLEGQLGLLDCLEDLTACELVGSCSQRSVWLRLRSAMVEGLEGILLSELAADMHQADDRSAYSI